MLICLVAVNAFDHDPRATSLAESLRREGHEVIVVAAGSMDEQEEDRTVRVPGRIPRGRSRLWRVLRDAQPEGFRNRSLELRIAWAARRTGAELFYATGPRAVRAARWAAGRSGAYAVTHRRWAPEQDDRDLAWVAPRRPETSRPGSGTFPPPRRHLTRDSAAGDAEPAPGRHAGETVYLCFRKTERNPGRYLESALERAGIAVRLVTDRLDWQDVRDDHARAVIFVESPMPPITIVGEKPDVPVAFWVHHGEHHINMNLRLARLFEADVVLLAHSWHLAHRFGCEVERLPFAIAPEMYAGAVDPPSRRPYDVAFVGRGLAGGGAYASRRSLLDAVAVVVPRDHIRFEEDVTPKELAGVYAQARIVPNEGGSRHLPVTMRVFEAIGAGAVLVTERAPGMDLLLEPGEHYVELRGDPSRVIGDLLADAERVDHIARAARHHCLQRHTYDHRVDEILDAVDRISGRRHPPPPVPTDPLAALVDRDVDVDRIVTDDGDLRAQLPEREVWFINDVRDRLAPASYEAVVLRDNPGPSAETIVAAARRLIYAAAPAHRAVLERIPDVATYETHDGLLRVDLHRDGYRI
jgi:hypothetical protein